MADIIYTYNNQVYFNITNKCPCRCTFCIRKNGDSVGEADNLWFKQEPTEAEILEAVAAFDFTKYKEAIFCGYGEPTMALDKLLAVSRYMREHNKNVHLRLNTNGLSDLIHDRSTAEEICGAVDSISISLNMPDAKSYNEVVRPVYGEKAFDSMLNFAKDCKACMDDVRFTVVDVIGAENVEKCKALSQSVGVPLRVREYIG